MAGNFNPFAVDREVFDLLGAHRGESSHADVERQRGPSDAKGGQLIEHRLAGEMEASGWGGGQSRVAGKDGVVTLGVGGLDLGALLGAAGVADVGRQRRGADSIEEGQRVSSFGNPALTTQPPAAPGLCGRRCRLASWSS